MDVTVMGKGWNGSYAWNKTHRADYIIEEWNVEERWEQLILQNRDRDAIEKLREKDVERVRWS